MNSSFSSSVSRARPASNSSSLSNWVVARARHYVALRRRVETKKHRLMPLDLQRPVDQLRYRDVARNEVAVRILSATNLRPHRESHLLDALGLELAQLLNVAPRKSFDRPIEGLADGRFGQGHLAPLPVVPHQAEGESEVGASLAGVAAKEG